MQESSAVTDAWLGSSDGVSRREDRASRLVHAHVSAGVPGDEVVGLRQRWPSEG